MKKSVKKRECILLKILILLIFLLPVCAADVNTSVEIENSPPVLSKEIPNISCATNESLENVYNLDDYFSDPNGQKLNYSYSGGENLTIEIENRSMISIYPDDNFEGTSQIVFHASDGDYEANSNTVYVNVGVDKEAPKWSNPSSPSEAYQNDYVNFSTQWTDNFQLSHYIFSIKQGGTWTNHSSVDFSGKENVSEKREQISAPGGTTVSWRFYAFDTAGNGNSTSVQQIQVQSEPEPSEDEEEYDGDLDDYDKSLEDYVREAIGEETEKEKSFDYDLSPDSFKISIKQGESNTRVLEITNKGNTNFSMDLSVSGIKDLVDLSEESFTLGFGETKKIVIDFNAEDAELGQYFGKLNIDSEIDKSIPIVIEINEYETEFEVTVNLSEEGNRVNPGESVSANISVENVKDIKETNATLEISIKDFYGNIYDTSSEQIEFSSSYSALKELKVPESADEGEYLFYAKAYNQESSAIDSGVFEVGTWIDVAAFLRTSSTFLIIFILSVFAIFLFLLHRKQKRKERVLNLYLMVSELRKLVKEGKMDEAVDLYVRMKRSYGENISKEDLDKEKLKENIEKMSKKMKRDVEKQAGEESEDKNEKSSDKESKDKSKKKKSKKKKDKEESEEDSEEETEDEDSEDDEGEEKEDKESEDEEEEEEKEQEESEDSEESSEDDEEKEKKTKKPSVKKKSKKKKDKEDSEEETEDEEEEEESEESEEESSEDSEEEGSEEEKKPKKEKKSDKNKKKKSKNKETKEKSKKKSKSNKKEKEDKKENE